LEWSELEAEVCGLFAEVIFSPPPVLSRLIQQFVEPSLPAIFIHHLEPHVVPAM